MQINLKPLVDRILAEYTLPRFGCHGVTHWARVLENGLRVAEQTGAEIEVVRLFAVFHDSRRVSESTDPQHGQRGADLAEQLRGKEYELADEPFQLLYKACAGHTTERTHPNVTVQTCWDADRLDLGRVGISPHPSRLCTEFAKKQKTIQWANERSTRHNIPGFVSAEWELDISQAVFPGGT